MSKMLVKCLKCLQTNADNTVAAGGQGVGWAYCPSSCPVEGELLCNNDKNKVNRCLASYSPRATTTNRPTNRALNKPAWPGPN